jgi:hypothetical protein
MTISISKTASSGGVGGVTVALIVLAFFLAPVAVQDRVPANGSAALGNAEEEEEDHRAGHSEIRPPEWIALGR